MTSPQDQCKKYNEKRLLLVAKAPDKWALFKGLNEDGTGIFAIFSSLTGAYTYAVSHGIQGNLIADIGDDKEYGVTNMTN